MTEMTVTTDNKNNLLTYTYDTDNLAKVSITTFSSMDGSVQYSTLNKGSFEALNSVLNPDNTNAQVYGGGGHDNPERNQKKIDLWGPRGENEAPLRCFTIGEGSKTAGFVNFGVSGMKDVNGNPIYEGGALFNADYNGSPVVTTAIDAVYGDYFASLHKDSLLPGGLFIYTVSAENPLYASLQASSSLVELDYSAKNVNGDDGEFTPHVLPALQMDQCIAEILAANPRFAGTTAYRTVESGVGKAVFYNLLDETLCPTLGEVPAEGSSEL